MIKYVYIFMKEITFTQMCFQFGINTISDNILYNYSLLMRSIHEFIDPLKYIDRGRDKHGFIDPLKVY